jgi:hypothetical protein
MEFLSQDFGTKLTHKIGVNYKRNNSRVNNQWARMQAVFTRFSRRHQHAIIRAYARTTYGKTQRNRGVADASLATLRRRASASALFDGLIGGRH